MRQSDTFVQYKPRHTIIFMEVLKIEEVTDAREICKVRWFLLDEKGMNVQSNFPMCTFKGEFANFVPIPRRTFANAVKLMKQMNKEHKRLKADGTLKADNAEFRKFYVNTRRKIVRMIKNPATSICKALKQVENASAMSLDEAIESLRRL